MHSVLRDIISDTRRQLNLSSAYREALEHQLPTLPPPIDFRAELAKPGRNIIAEIKRKSPSEGALRRNVEPTAVAQAYEASGAAAISVLTEPNHFDGSLVDLERVAECVSVPCLRKDFIVDPIQILEARVHGASAFLLITAALSDREMSALIRYGEELNLTPLVEVHTAEELSRAEAAGSTLVGVNNRDLNDLSIDLRTSETLRPLFPEHILPVTESGILTISDLHRLEQAGYGAFLVGSSLMKAEQPGQHLRQLLTATVEP